MASRKPRAPPPPQSSKHATPVSIPDALSKLGMTTEQFLVKQAELLEGLLQNRPFVPQTSNARHSSLCEKVAFGHMHGKRSRSSSMSSSSSSRAPSPAPPRTPSQANHVGGALPRARDQMELVLEGKNRRKESQRQCSTSRSRQSERVSSTPSRSSGRVAIADLPPETPHHYRYYSERVVGEASASKRSAEVGDQPDTPSRGRDRGQFKVPLPRYFIPGTLSRQGLNSSCPATPRSSPPPVVNLVSSPGPMRTAPPAEDNLPFILPPEPYSPAKPELSYAAIIGRAILASAQHALSLQDIYEYITIVFPYYKRGEPTWMNSVRHALSTMAVFRKVQRGRAEGKSLWAIWDIDIPCFAGGGFKKTLCADMTTGNPRGSKRRSAEEGGGPRSKRKKTRDDRDNSQGPLVPAPIMPPHFPHFAQQSNPHHQSYYQVACIQQQQPLPAEALFPPLPSSSNYHRVVAQAASMPAAHPLPDEIVEQEEGVLSSSPIERPPSTSSLPDLVSSLSTSSSPSPSSYLSLHDDISRAASPEVSPPPTLQFPSMDPMAEWFQSGSPLRETSPPTIPSHAKGKGKARTSSESSERKLPRMMVPTLPPSSPTPQRRASATIRRSTSSSHQNSVPTAHKSKSSTADTVAEVMRALEHAIEGGRSPSHQGSLLPSDDDAVERPSTPIRRTPPPPWTPSRYGLPSTPSRVEWASTPNRLDKLEAELFNFSPLRPSKSADAVGLWSHSPNLPTGVSRSPSLSVFTSRASLMVDSMDEFFSGPSSRPTRSPATLPRTPKKSPRTLMRIPSPSDTPSRSTRYMAQDLDDDLARFLQSPRHDAFDSVATGLPGSQLGSPSSESYW